MPGGLDSADLQLKRRPSWPARVARWSPFPQRALRPTARCGRALRDIARDRARLAAVVLAVNATTRRQARCATRPVAARSPHTERSPVRRAAKRMLVLAHAQHKHTPTER